jgi:signal transduction histidine kinase
MLFNEDRPCMLMANLLHSGEDVIGFAIFEPGPEDERVYNALAIHISTALSRAILLEKLESSYKSLVDQAHRKGMAGIASGILHNIGNILNSINASIHLIKDLVGTSPIKDLQNANSLLEKNIEEIEDFIYSNEKGKKLMMFYTKLGEPMMDFQAQLSGAIKRLTYNIKMIEDIMAAQQNYAGARLSLEDVDIVSFVEDVLKMSSASLEKRCIKIVRNYGSNLPKSLVQRTKLFHILVNMINNAKDAMQETPEDSRILTVSVSRVDSRNCIRISDTGHGIPPELLERIFAYGYTTKKDGHGFGLHSCANYLSEMGGKIWAESGGTGKGACFVVQLQN